MPSAKKRFGIIFDCDGTLVDSLGQALESFNFALAELGEEPRTPEQIKQYFGTAADRILIQVLGDEQRALLAFEHYLVHQKMLAQTTPLHPGIRTLLDVLVEEFPLALVTGRHSRDLDMLLEVHELKKYFVTLVADDELERSKPHPDGILLAAERLGLEPGQCCYVGDSVNDILAAKAAGCLSVAALWDALANVEAMRKADPTFLAKEPADVQEYAEKAYL